MSRFYAWYCMYANETKVVSTKNLEHGITWEIHNEPLPNLGRIFTWLKGFCSILY